MNQPTLFPTAPTARRTDPDTSKAAGARQVPATSMFHAAIVAAIVTAGLSGLTDDELVQKFPDKCDGSTKKRRCEVARAGLVHDSGRRRPTRTGSDAIVWVAS